MCACSMSVHSLAEWLNVRSYCPMLGCFHLQGRVIYVPVALVLIPGLNVRRLFVAIASARENDLCVPVASVLIP